MRFVIDTNEFIFALGIPPHPFSERVFNLLVVSFPKNTIHIPRTIINEVKNNLPPNVFAVFIKTIQMIAIIDEDIEVPFELGAKYESLGLRAADAFIAAYSEYIGADALVTENRHFLSRQRDLPFKILTAEQCLKILSKG